MKLQKGYKAVRDKVLKNSKWNKSCTNCDYYYQASGDKEEVCQNLGVLEYDMVVQETRIYCLQWVLSKRTKSLPKNKSKKLNKKNIFKVGG